MEAENKPEEDETKFDEEMEQEDPDEIFEGPKDIGGFTVLGEFTAREKTKVDRVLPNWLQYPLLIQNNQSKKFSDIKELDESLIKKLTSKGILQCFPVQWTVIPELLAQGRHGIYSGDAGFRPRDICVSAPTGSGKTLTFALPIIQALQNRVVRHVRALVILPVKDLAVQVHSVFQEYSEGTSLKICLLAGRKDFQTEQRNLVQERLYADPSEKWMSSADIVVATRGRLLDHIERTEGFDLTHLRYLVVDEADRQMEDIYDEWLEHVEKAAYTPKPGAYCPYHRERPGPLTVASSKDITMHMQKLLFSATLSQNPEKLEHMSLFLPVLFTTMAPRSGAPSEAKSGEINSQLEQQILKSTVDQFSTPNLLKEKYLDCKASEKPLVLLHFLLNEKWEHVLCFTNTVETAHRLYLMTKQIKGVTVAELSSLVHNEKRERIIKQFTRGDIQILICSDVMTRGMDIENVEYVISYDSPSYIETYIHRVGRTARANKPGTALTFIEGKEAFHFKRMLRESGRWNKLKHVPVKPKALEPLIPEYTAALKIVPDILKEQRRKKKSGK